MRGPLARRGRRRLRHRRAGGGLPRRRATSTRSSTSAGRTSTSRSTPASRSGCRRSGRRSSGAAPSAWAMASGSSTTSRSATTARSSSVGWPRSSATGACRSRCARPRTSTPAPRASIAEHPIDLLRRLRYRVTREHGQPADERRHAVERVRGARRRVRDRPRRDGVADDQRAEERVRAVRRAAPAHQRGREAGLRPAPGRGGAGRHRRSDGQRRPSASRRSGVRTAKPTTSSPSMRRPVRTSGAVRAALDPQGAPATTRSSPRPCRGS